MSINYYWRRIPSGWLESKSPRELGDSSFRGRDASEQAPLLSVLNSCSLMHFVLTTAAPDNSAATLPLFGGSILREGEEHPEYGFVGAQLFSLTPDEVRAAAEFLAQSPLERWVLDRRPLIREHARELLFSSVFSEDWALYLAESLLELRDYFQTAANEGQAVVSYQSA